jgi:hypothetical protein
MVAAAVRADIVDTTRRVEFRVGKMHCVGNLELDVKVVFHSPLVF